MVNARMAYRVLPHCQPGSALDILTRAATTVPQLTASPSPDVVWAKIKAGNLALESVAALVAATDSADVLAKVVKKDKRLKIRRAAAANKHLGDEEFRKLFDEARTKNDTKTLLALWQGRDLTGKITMINEMPHITWYLGNWDHVLAQAIARGGDPVLHQVTSTLEGGKLHDLLRSLCEREYGGNTSAVALAKAIVEHATATIESPNHRVISGLVSTLIRPNDPVEVWREVLDLIPTKDMLLGTISASARGETRLPQDELIRRAEDPKVLELVISALGQQNIPLEASTVEAALTLPHRIRALETAPYTPEAIALLAQRGETELLASRLRSLGDVQQIKAYLEELDGLVEKVSLDVTTVWELHHAGLRKDLAWKLTSRSIDRYGSLRHAELRALVISDGPLEILSQLNLEIKELEAAMGRTDRELVLPSIAKRLLAHGRDLPEDMRREAYLALGPTNVKNALSGSNAMKAGDLPYFLERCSEEQRTAIIDEARRLVLYSDIGAWGPDAVRTMPLDWKDIHNSSAIKVMLGVLTEAFEEDAEKWQTGLTLLAEWTGTLDGLVETVEIL